MITALLIIAMLFVLFAIGYTVYGVATGCPFALFTLFSGGFSVMLELLGKILEGFAGE